MADTLAGPVANSRLHLALVYEGLTLPWFWPVAWLTVLLAMLGVAATWMAL